MFAASLRGIGRQAASQTDPTLQGPTGLELASRLVEQGGLPPRSRPYRVLRLLLLPFLRQPESGGGSDADRPRSRALALRAGVPAARVHRELAPGESGQERHPAVRHGLQVHVRRLSVYVPVVILPHFNNNNNNNNNNKNPL